MSRKIIVKLPLNKQVLNNNYNDIHWSEGNDQSLIKIIESSNIKDFTVSGLNIEELSSQNKVPIDFLLKKFIQLYNEIELKKALPVVQEPILAEKVVKNHLYNLEDNNVSPLLQIRSPPPSDMRRSVIDPETGKTEITNGNYSYYIDKNGYSSDNNSDENDDDDAGNDSDELPKMSDILLHRSRLLPIPKLNNSSIEDIFSDRDEDQKEESLAGFKLNLNDNDGNFSNNKPTATITNEDITGIISNKKLGRQNSGSSDLSNRSELEKALLERL